MSCHASLAAFITLYQALNKNNLARLGQVYHRSVHFKDALHEVHGLTALERYFAGLYENLEQCQFEILHSQCVDTQAFLVWEMRYRHPRINRGAEIVVEGSSHLRFVDNKVIYHRDYLDMGQMLYEHLPLMGPVVRWVKGKASA